MAVSLLICDFGWRALNFFGFDAEMGLQYRGRFETSRKEAGSENLRRDLFEAMKQVAETGRGPKDQIPLMGCSIK